MDKLADTQVLIVGAGPSGLMMACQLALYGIRFRIIEKKIENASYSGALFIQAKTLEIFDKMGIADKAISLGTIVNTVRIGYNKNKLYSADIHDFGKGLSKTPFILMLEQGITEQLLSDFIISHNITIERNTELLTFTQANENIFSRLKMPDGTLQVCKSLWLVAADGGQSSIRQHLNIPFKGVKHNSKLFILDCEAHVNMVPGQIGFFFSDETIMGIFPLSAKCRVDGDIPDTYLRLADNTHEEIKSIMTRNKPFQLECQKILHFSTFYARGFVADSFRQDRCFLIGDAAHVFSPVGAQGMNTGMQDAYNLAWKLSFVIKNTASAQFLDSYQDERQRLARRVVKKTNKISWLLLHKNYFIKKAKYRFIPFFIKSLFFIARMSEKVRHFIFRGISEIGINYRVNYRKTSSGSFTTTAPGPGDPLPYVFFNEKTNIQDNVKEKYCLIIFSGTGDYIEKSQISEKYKSIMQIVIIPFIAGNMSIYKRFGVKKTGIYLVRPDSFIALRCDSLNFEFLENYFQSIVK